MAMLTKPARARKEKVTISVDADLLQMIDAFVEDAKDGGISRSSVFEQALQLWKQALRDSFDAQYYSQNAQALNDESWRAITTEAAKHIWNE